MPAGKPLKFKTPQELEEKIEAYFKSRCDEEGNPVKPISITGLALALDTTRETICDYGERDEYSDSIRKARLRVENFYEERLTFANATGPIFALKNFDWKDTQDLNHGGQNGKNPIKYDNDIDSRISELLIKTGAAGAIEPAGGKAQKKRKK